MSSTGVRDIDITGLLNREADALARPCVYLRDRGSDYAGVWETASTRSGPRLLFDTRWLPFENPPGPGCISVAAPATVTFEKGRALPDRPAGLRLYAHPAVSLPPLDAIFQFGSGDVQRWLQACNWKPEWGYNANFPARAAADAYERRYQDHLPLYTRDAHAVLGGWHFPWPDGDWHELADARLLAWSFEGAEPWLEVWARGDRMWVVPRIT